MSIVPTIMIAGKDLGQSANKRLGLLLGYRRDDGHVPVRPSLANDTVPQKDKPVIDVGDMGLLHIQPQLQAAFQKGTAFLANLHSMGFRPLDNDDKIIGISTIRDSRFPLPVLTNRNGAPLLNWLAQKYRSRIKSLMLNWYRAPETGKAKTWLVYGRNERGERVGKALRRMVSSPKAQFRWRNPEINPYIFRSETRSTVTSRYHDVAMAMGQA